MIVLVGLGFEIRQERAGSSEWRIQGNDCALPESLYGLHTLQESIRLVLSCQPSKFVVVFAGGHNPIFFSVPLRWSEPESFAQVDGQKPIPLTQDQDDLVAEITVHLLYALIRRERERR